MKKNKKSENRDKIVLNDNELSRWEKMRKRIRTFRFMMIAFFVVIIGLSAFLTGTLFVLGYLARIRPIHGLPITMLILYPMVISGMLALVLTAAWSGRMLRPMKLLTAATKRVAAGDFSVRVPESEDSHAHGELAELVHSFNLMAEDLEGIELFRKDFINNFSHEFKTPIVSIRGFAKQLYNDELTDEQRREYIDIIIAESDRLAGMSTNVLLLSKLENQTIVTDKQEFYLDEQLRHEILLLESAWERKNISFSPELEEVCYIGSSELMSHIWRNLLSNAIKFSPDGSEVRVNLYRKEGQIVVEVADEGPGMDKETALHIFDKFYQGDTSHKTEGNGLGLAIAHRAAVLCGATLSVRSAPNCGCTFVVKLPEVSPAQ